MNAVLLNVLFFMKILNSTAVFNIDDGKKLFLRTKSPLEWFLKDHVTLKTKVMAAENSALPSE